MVGLQQVESGRDDRLNGVGQRKIVRFRGEVDRPLLGYQPHQFGDVQGIATASFEECLLCMCRHDRFPGEPHQEFCGFLRFKWRQRHRGGVAFATAPLGVIREELRPGRSEHKDRRFVGPVENVFDELEQHTVGPLKILQH